MDLEIESFDDFGLDHRLQKSIKMVGWSKPTGIQSAVIPLALEGKDILVSGRTGCGKTAAYLIPILNRIIIDKQNNCEQRTSAVILAPTKELCRQIFVTATQLNRSSSNLVRITSLLEGKDEKINTTIIEDQDLIVSTPAKLIKYTKMESLCSGLKFLVVDEADLVFSFFYKEEILKIFTSAMNNSFCQCFLVSATLEAAAEDIKEMKKFLKNPVSCKLEEPDIVENLDQYVIKCDDDEKFVILAALFKLNLIAGKTLIFVNTTNMCYKIKLFLEQFGVRSCVLNSELPVKSRCLTIEEFNKGVYEIIIANDAIWSDADKNDEKNSKDNKDSKESSKKKRRTEDNLSNVSRGIDFQFVSNVVNFDFPLTVASYIHRVGRTARGSHDTDGTVLSLICPKEMPRYELMKEKLQIDSNFKPYNFRMEELEAFRYRSRDALRAVTGIAIKEARIKEIRKELLSSEKLKAYFKANPKDLKVLTQDKTLGTTKQKFNHLKHIPDYIVPPTLQSVLHGSKGSRKKLPGQDATLHLVSHSVKRRKNKSNKKKIDPLNM
ncbi:probable ATP-dependent RNA helicase DDX56 [Tetranychus urticae]|uniref:RNA helicase n=1 Tax=Tetranychus urticae TaxID=32264 RepID=T1KQ06_TETUR|nr:probable ATP-dependent RNA helicase DDX56 [Tetranychus urticae]